MRLSVKCLMSAMFVGSIAMSGSVLAGNRYSPIQPSPIGIGIGNAEVGDVRGGDGGDVEIKQRRQWPNGTAIGAASSNTTAPYRYLDSHSTSVLFFARSRTQMLFDVVTFVASDPAEPVKQAACFAEQSYRDYRQYIGKPCAAIE